MSKPQTYFDRRRAAAGDVDDTEAAPLAPIGSLLDALKTHATGRRSSDENNRSNEPEQESKILKEKPTSNLANMRVSASSQFECYSPDVTMLLDKVQHCRTNWTPGVNRHKAPTREIFVEVGKSEQGSKTKMSMGIVEAHQLKFEAISEMYTTEYPLIMERSKMNLAGITLDRSKILDKDGKSFHGVMLEIAFSSQLKDESRSAAESRNQVYIGKTKLFFPMQYRKMLVWLDLCEL